MTVATTENMIVTRIRSAMAGIVTHPAELVVERVDGLHSLTNWIRRVVDPVTGLRYAARVPNPVAEGPLGIVRREERALVRHAARHGFGPPVLAASEDGVLIMPFLTEVRRWSGADVAADVAGDRRLTSVLSAMFSTGDVPFTGPTMFDRVGRMIDGADGLGSPIPGRDRLLARLHHLADERSRDSRFPRSVAHHDLYSNNLLDTGDELYIIDFEFGGVGDGWVDLSTVARGAGLDENGRRTLLANLGRPSGADELALLDQLSFVTTLFDACWAWIMANLGTTTVLGGQAFDYTQHAQNQFSLLLA